MPGEQCCYLKAEERHNFCSLLTNTVADITLHDLRPGPEPELPIYLNEKQPNCVRNRSFIPY